MKYYYMLNNRDLSILKHIVSYCDEIEHTCKQFNNNYDEFISNSIFQNAVALCVLQIGELVTHLTDEFKTQYNKMPWVQIKAMRNIVAHNYGKIDIGTLWETITEDTPSLKDYCLSIINNGK